MTTWTAGSGHVIPLDQISAAGTYRCVATGHLIQVPPTALVDGVAWRGIVGNDALRVTRISDDWNLTIAEVRLLTLDPDAA